MKEALLLSPTRGYYLYKKWTKEKVFAFIDSLETTVPSLSKEFYFLKESFKSFDWFREKLFGKR
jgi:hypothetical protein